MPRVDRMLSVLAFASVAIATCGGSDALAADAGAPSPLPACVQVTTQSRYVPFGYNHVVILKNGCARAASCTVATDVNPDPRAAEVPAGTVVEVTTFMGAAASTFNARVSCQLR